MSESIQFLSSWLDSLWRLFFIIVFDSTLLPSPGINARGWRRRFRQAACCYRAKPIAFTNEQATKGGLARSIALFEDRRSPGVELMTCNPSAVAVSRYSAS